MGQALTLYPLGICMKSARLKPDVFAHLPPLQFLLWLFSYNRCTTSKMGKTSASVSSLRWLLLTAWEGVLCWSPLALIIGFWFLPWPYAFMPLIVWTIPMMTPYKEFAPFTKILDWLRIQYRCQLINTHPLPKGPFGKQWLLHLFTI